MNNKLTKNSEITITVPALTFGTLAIQAAQAGIDISTLLTREALARQGRNNVPAAALPPVPAPVPAPVPVTCPAPAMFPTPSPVVVNGADPDLNLR